jgi:hypothetical protein
MKIYIKLHGKRLEIPRIIRCKNKALGLMFSSKERASNLLFEFASPGFWTIHSFFVFYSFLAIWILENKVVDYKIVKPFSPSVKSQSAFTKLLEIPLNEKNKNLVASLLGDKPTLR